MKFIFSAALLLLVLSVGCKKPPGTSGTAAIYKGVVLHNICCQDVIQTLGANLLGQDTWVDSNSGVPTTYHHVFKVANPCQFGGHAAGDTVQFRIIEQQPQNCACCMLFVYTPSLSYAIQVTN